MDDAIITSHTALLPFQIYKLVRLLKRIQRKLRTHTPDAINVFLTKRWEKKEICIPITPTAIPPPSWIKAHYTNRNTLINVIR